jgi:hypothetical protein
LHTSIIDAGPAAAAPPRPRRRDQLELDALNKYESSRLVRTQILQQAGAAILAQANQEPALALKLLQG